MISEKIDVLYLTRDDMFYIIEQTIKYAIKIQNDSL